MGNECIGRNTLIAEITLLVYVVIQRLTKIFPVQITDGVVFKHPLFLGDVVIPNLSGMFINSLKDSAMKGNNTLSAEIQSI